MKLSGADFKLIRWSLFALCATLLLSSLILYSSSRYAVAAGKDLRMAQNKLKDARKQLAMAHEDLVNLADYSQEYAKLENDKIIGDDHRLDWVDTLERLRNQNLVIDFRYTIAPQKTYVPQPAMDSGNFDIHYSETKLELDLLHEGQLLDFLDALRKRGNGWYQLEGCTMKRINSYDENAAPATPNIKADCSGGWITLKNRNAPS